MRFDGNRLYSNDDKYLGWVAPRADGRYDVNVCFRHGSKWLGIELNKEQAKQALLNKVGDNHSIRI